MQCADGWTRLGVAPIHVSSAIAKSTPSCGGARWGGPSSPAESWLPARKLRRDANHLAGRAAPAVGGRNAPVGDIDRAGIAVPMSGSIAALISAARQPAFFCDLAYPSSPTASRASDSDA
jgi:hypothetical protein